MQEEVRQLRRRLSDLEVALEEEKQSRKELKQLISLKEDEVCITNNFFYTYNLNSKLIIEFPLVLSYYRVSEIAYGTSTA